MSATFLLGLDYVDLLYMVAPAYCSLTCHCTLHTKVGWLPLSIVGSVIGSCLF